MSSENSAEREWVEDEEFHRFIRYGGLFEPALNIPVDDPDAEGLVEDAVRILCRMDWRAPSTQLTMSAVLVDLAGHPRLSQVGAGILSDWLLSVNDDTATVLSDYAQTALRKAAGHLLTCRWGDQMTPEARSGLVLAIAT